MKLKVYQYKKCSTCQKALKFLSEKGVEFDSIPIEQKPPSLEELKLMLQCYDGNIRKLFNTSGKLYREMNIKDKLGQISEEEALKILSNEGMIVKRPFLISGQSGLVGFKESDWETFLGELS